MTTSDNRSKCGIKPCSSLRVKRGDSDDVRKKAGGPNTAAFTSSSRKVASVDCIVVKEREGRLPPSHSLLLPSSLSPVILVVERKHYAGGDAEVYCSRSDSTRVRNHSGSFSTIDVGVDVQRGSKMEIGSIGGVMQGPSQHVSGGQVRYFQALMDRTSDLQVCVFIPSINRFLTHYPLLCIFFIQNNGSTCVHHRECALRTDRQLQVHTPFTIAPRNMYF